MAAQMENRQYYANMRRAEQSLTQIGSDFFPIAVVEVILRPNYN